MKSYSEEEIKEWFNIMKEKYAHSPLCESLEMIELAMFDRFWESENIDKILKKN